MSNKYERIISKDNLEDDNNIENELINRLKEVHKQSEERTFDLNEKFDQIRDYFQKLINIYKNNLEQEEDIDNNIDFFSLKNYINNYITKERETSINNINEVFEEVSKNIKKDINDNSQIKDEIKVSLIEIKKIFEQKYNQLIKVFEEAKSENVGLSDNIENQMKEQFDKINNILDKEINEGNSNKNDIISKAQKFLLELGRKIKLQKQER